MYSKSHLCLWMTVFSKLKSICGKGRREGIREGVSNFCMSFFFLSFAHVIEIAPCKHDLYIYTTFSFFNYFYYLKPK